jgi:hypothetical protein
MIRAKWRTPLGVALGAIASEVLWRLTPSATFRAVPISQSLVAAGLGIPDWAFNAMETLHHRNACRLRWRVGRCCAAHRWHDTIRRGMNLGIIVACVDVGIPLP